MYFTLPAYGFFGSQSNAGSGQFARWSATYLTKQICIDDVIDNYKINFFISGNYKIDITGYVVPIATTNVGIETFIGLQTVTGGSVTYSLWNSSTVAPISLSFMRYIDVNSYLSAITHGVGQQQGSINLNVNIVFISL